MKKTKSIPCCKYDHNGDGNCHIHSSPGVLRCLACKDYGFVRCNDEVFPCSNCNPDGMIWAD